MYQQTNAFLLAPLVFQLPLQKQSTPRTDWRRGEQEGIAPASRTLSFSSGGCEFEHPRATGLQRSLAIAVRTDSVLRTRLIKSEQNLHVLKKKRLRFASKLGKIHSQEWVAASPVGTEPRGRRRQRQRRRQKLRPGPVALPRPSPLATPARPPG